MPGSHWFLPPSTPCRPNSQHHSRFHHLPARAAPSSTTVAGLGIFHLLRQLFLISLFLSSLFLPVVSLVFFFFLFHLFLLSFSLSRLFIFFLSYFSPILVSYFSWADFGHLHRHVMHQILTTSSVLLVPTLRPAYACVHLYILMSLKTQTLQQAILICQRHLDCPEKARPSTSFRGCGLSG